jgi:hypothetical protein
MLRLVALAAIIGLAASAARAQEPVRFKFVKNEVLSYSIIQNKKIVETIIDEQTKKPVEQQESVKHSVIRRWKVSELDAKGIATLEMSIASMRWERKLPNGMTDTFDSSNPEDAKSNQLAHLIGPVVAIVCVDGFGRVVEVKDTKFARSARFAAIPPFQFVLSESAPKLGSIWDRPFTIKLDPPHGTGEKYEAVQKYVVKAPVNGLTTIGVTTTIKDLPAQTADQIPLMDMLWEGDVYFHEASGRYYAARLTMKKELLNHAGEGTKYSYESAYQEDLKLDK